MQATIFDIKHYAIHDGPGIRQTIFFKGCPLSCWWCHNPESRSSEVIDLQREEVVGDKQFCVTETIGRKYSIDEVLMEIEKDIVFFEESGGGITLSGGEPLKQYDFALELLKKCKKREIHTCVDTTGNVSGEKLNEIAKFTDIFLYDIKHVDDKQHIKYAGVSNKQIISNLKMLDEMGKDIWIRIPLIPNINDDESEILRLLELLSGLKNRYPIQLLPFHKIGNQKYEKFGIKYHMSDTNEPDEEHNERILKMFHDAGHTASIGG